MILSFESNPKFENAIATIINRLVLEHESVLLITPAKSYGITKTEAVSRLVDPWRNKSATPWIMAGKKEPLSGDESYSGPFINDCKNDGFNTQVDDVLAVFDWAIFSYFTTYHYTRNIFVSNVIEAEQLLASKGGNNLFVDIDKYALSDNPISALPSATFYDYDIEGLHVFELSKKRGEEPAYLICHLIDDPQDLYYKWNRETQESEDRIWFDEYLNELEFVSEVRIGGRGQYLIYRVTSEQAYLNIWQEASEDHSIAEATLSGDTIISDLEQYLAKNSAFSIDDKLLSFCSWGYCQIYGGGADEHHALFRSKSSEITNQLWTSLGSEQISRF